MNEKSELLHEACDVMFDEYRDLLDRVRKNNGQMSMAELDEMDKLSHAIKSNKTTLAMMEAEGGSYAYESRRMYDDRSENDGYGTYARRRDSMGRYTSRRYDGR